MQQDIGKNRIFWCFFFNQSTKKLTQISFFGTEEKRIPFLRSRTVVDVVVVVLLVIMVVAVVGYIILMKLLVVVVGMTMLVVMVIVLAIVVVAETCIEFRTKVWGAFR